jgi:hypothetical protein
MKNLVQEEEDKLIENDIQSFSRDDMELEIDNWMVYYSTKNHDIEEAIHGISHDLRDLEGELFNIKIRHKINVAPMKNYNEDWFKKEIDKLTKEGQEATVDIVHISVNENNKMIAASK